MRKTITESIENKIGTKLVKLNEVQNEIVPFNEDSNEEIVTVAQQNLEQDYNFAVKNIRTIIEKSMHTVDNVVAIATESESPRMFEAASTFLKTLSDLNKDLVELSKSQVMIENFNSKKDSNEKEVKEQSIVQNNAFFVGTTESINSMIEEKIKKIANSNIIDND